MKNVTITLDEQTAHWARIEAAKSGKSLSRWIGERLEQERQREAGPVSALEDFLSGPGYPGIAAALPERETLYAERDLPRHEHPDLQPRSGRRVQTG